MKMPDNARSVEVGIWYVLGDFRPWFIVKWTPGDTYADEDDSERERKYRTMKAALAKVESLLTAKVNQ